LQKTEGQYDLRKDPQVYNSIIEYKKIEEVIESELKLIEPHISTAPWALLKDKG